MSFAWYAATTKPFSEFVAEDNLARQGWQPFNARCEIIKIQRGARVAVSKPYIPGYIFVRFDMDVNHRWPAINNTRGVRRLMPEHCERPSPLPEKVMRLLLDKCSGSLVDAKHVDAALSKLIPVGTRVSINPGVLVGLEGFEAPVVWSHHDRVTVLLSLFGRQSEVKLRRDQVEQV